MTAAQMDSLQANDYNWTVSNKTASYVLVAADKGTRVVMNSASATTITVNTSLFSAGDTLFIQNIGAGTCTITAGTATVTTASSLALAQWGGGTLYFTSASAAIFFSGGGTGYGAATGGSSSSITVGGVNYTLLTFTSTGTLTVTKAGFFDYLLIGGGSGTSYFAGTIRPSGGGGSGAVSVGSVYLSANQTVTIGAGGSFTAWGTASEGGNTTLGATSPFNPLAVGSKIKTLNTGTSTANFCIGGGIGAGAAENVQVFNFGLGYNGGNSFSSGDFAAGGGGGNQGAGAAGVSSTQGGNGGDGFDVSSFIGGSASYRATGGGGGAQTTPGTGGSSNASSNTGGTTAAAPNAAANSGSGAGGGRGNPLTSGNGGSGVAYIRFKV